MFGVSVPATLEKKSQSVIWMGAGEDEHIKLRARNGIDRVQHGEEAFDSSFAASSALRMVSVIAVV